MILELWAAFILFVLVQMATGAKYSPATVSFGGTTQTSTTTQAVEAASPDDLALKAIDLEFSELNLERFKQEQAIIDRILAEGGEDSIVQANRIEQELLPLREAAARAELELAPQLTALQAEQIGAASARIPLEQKILEEQVASIERGGLPSEEVSAEIDKLLEASRGIGTTSIQEQGDRAIEKILEEIAPSRGLRGDDTPILERLSDIGRQVTTETGQLERKLAESRSSLNIGQPVQIGQLSANITAPSLNRTAPIPFSPSSFLPNVQPTSAALGTVAGSRAGASTNFAPTFGPQFFVTGQSSSSGRTTPNIGSSFLSGAGAGLGAFAALR